MPTRSVLIIVLLAVLLPGVIQGAAQPDTLHDPTSGIRIVRSSAQSATLELRAPAYRVAPAGSGKAQQLTVPGAELTTVPGQPQLPYFTAALGVPANVPVHVRITAEATSELSQKVVLTSAPQPAPLHADLQPGTFTSEPDPATYTSTAAYPANPAQVLDDAWMRDQRMVRVAVYPFQYTPKTGQLVWHSYLQIEVRWGSATPPQAASALAASASDPFEAMLKRTLLNYADARAWRAAPSTRTDRSAQQDAVHGAVASQPRYKIVVDQDGMYQLTYADLQAAGVDVDRVDPRQFGLTNRGAPVAIEVIGAADGRFDPADSVIFWGQKFTDTSTPDTIVLNRQVVTTTTKMSQLYSTPTTYTDQNVYWLDPAGPPSPRMIVRDGAPDGTAPVPPSYRTTARAEQSNVWWTWHFTSRDTWLWDRVATGSETTRSYATTLSAIAPDAPTATVRGEVVARSGSDASDADHHTRFLLNDATTELEDATWDGLSRHRFEASVPQSALREGENNLLFNLIAQPELGFDDVLFDWFEIEYARQFRAVADQITFAGDVAGTWQYQIEDFSAPDVRVYDLRDPRAPSVIANVQTSAVDGRYRAAFQTSHTSGAQFTAVTTAALQQPRTITSYSAPDLRTQTDGADYIFITHRDFRAGTERLASYRAAHGLRTLVVDVDDVYNQFNDGIYSPLAIKKFLAYTYAHWSAPAPSYVVLVGDGHWNAKGYNAGVYGASPIYMPPNLAWVDPWQGEVDSTNLLAAIVGDDLMPDLAIGRLPVQSTAELDRIIDKIVAYEAAPMQNWQRHLLFAADNTPDAAGDFVALSEEIIADVVPTDYEVDRLYMTDLCGSPTIPATRCAPATTQLIETLNTTGTLLLSYVGHASIRRWAHEPLLVNQDLAQLNNADRLPIVLSMTCLDGYWFYPNQSGLAEDFVRTSSSGAIATFSPTGLGVAVGHDVLQRGFYEALFQDGARTLGAASLAAKQALYTTGHHDDLMNTFVIIGDPALRIPLPAVEPSPSMPTPTPSPAPLHVFLPVTSKR